MVILEQRETVKILAELIQSQMQLEKDLVSIYNQRRTLKPKVGFYIDVAIIGMDPYAANSAMALDPSQHDLLEVQTIAQREIYQIDIFSQDDSARLQRIQILFALTGVAAQQAMEEHAFQIARIPQSWLDISELEGAARLNRYALTITVLRSYSQARTSPTFTEFTVPPKAILVNQ